MRKVRDQAQRDPRKTALYVNGIRERERRMKQKHMVIFQPSARRGQVDEDTSLIEASRQLGVDIEALCGEKKVCGKCKIRIEEGSFEKFGITSKRSHVSEWQEEEDKFFTPEQKEAGYRLGCVAKVQGDLLVFVPEESRAGKQVVSKAARDIHIDWNPAVKLYRVKVEPPSLRNRPGTSSESAQNWTASTA